MTFLDDTTSHDKDAMSCKDALQGCLDKVKDVMTHDSYLKKYVQSYCDANSQKCK